MSDSLWDTIKSAFGSEPPPEELAPAPVELPTPPVIRREANESDLDFSLRKRKILFEHKKLVEDMQMNPEKYSRSVSQEDPALRNVIEEAATRSQRELEKLGE